MRYCKYIIIIFIVFPLFVCAREVSFIEYLAGFKKLQGETITREAFGDTIIKSPECTDCAKFLPTLSMPEYKDGDLVWQKGSVVKTENYYITFQTLSCEKSYESFVSDIIITYSVNGSLIDYAIVGKHGQMCYTKNLCGNIYDFNVEIATILNKSDFYQWGDITFSVEKKNIKIDSLGKISERIESRNTEIMPRDKEIRSHVTFTDYLSHFKKADNGNVSNLADSERQAAQLSAKYVFNFLPNGLDCECEPRFTPWYPVAYTNMGNIIIALVRNLCDLPQNDSAISTMLFAVTYTLDGKVIDFKQIGKKGDYWKYKILPQSKQNRLFVEQTTLSKQFKIAKLEKKIITIKRNGVIICKQR